MRIAVPIDASAVENQERLVLTGCEIRRLPELGQSVGPFRPDAELGGEINEVGVSAGFNVEPEGLSLGPTGRDLLCVRGA